MHFKYKDTKKWKVKGWETIQHANNDKISKCSKKDENVKTTKN